MNERIRAYRDTLLLTLIALPLGLAIGAMDALFGRVLLSVTAFRMAHVYSLAWWAWASSGAIRRWAAPAARA